MRKCLVLVTMLLSVSAISASPALAAVPECRGPVSQKTLYSGQGLLESVIAGGGGKLYVSGSLPGEDGAALLRFDRPGQEAKVVATAPPGPGGLTWKKRRLLWGNGNTIAGGQGGDADPRARLLSVNVRNGRYFTWASGLGMANGVTSSARGAVFSSNDFGLKLDRISPRGVTNHGWAEVESGNGLVVGKNGGFLYVAQTFVSPSRIAMVSTRNPGRVLTYFESPDQANVIFDGLARDGQNNLYVAALATGEIWKITPAREACVLAKGITQVSNLAFGAGRRGFSRANLYAVNFAGDIVRITGARRATLAG